jgi:hypothetical protein
MLLYGETTQELVLALILQPDLLQVDWFLDDATGYNDKSHTSPLLPMVCSRRKAVLAVLVFFCEGCEFLLQS